LTVNVPLYFAELRGDSRQRGFQHGTVLKQSIGRGIEFYRHFFAEYLGMDAEEMRLRAARFIEPTARSFPLLLDEYEGIAEGSTQRLEDIFVLSARYEMTYESLKLGECSNVFVGPGRSENGHPLLGMNWEWRPEVLEFRAVLICRCDDLPDHIVVTECGQPGKYGLNENGVVAIETGLGCSQNITGGENLFVLNIRHALAQDNLNQAAAVIRDHPPEATISFFLADASGNGINLEVAPAGIAERPLAPDEIYWHTNHCRLTDEACSLEDSFTRGRRWQTLTSSAEQATWQTVGSWLADTENGSDSICRSPNPDLRHTATWLQTLCSIVLDPQERALWVTDGMSSENPYVRFDFNSRPGS